MPSIYATSKDGRDLSFQSGWSSARDTTDGSSASHTLTSFVNAIQARKARGTTYIINRSFFRFDTSSISVTPSDATLKIYGRTNSSADFFVVKSSQGLSLGTDDFDAIDGWNNSGVDNEANVTKYSSEVTSWSTSGYNDITLNATATLDMSNLDALQICLIESVHDLRNVAPTGTFSTGLYYQDQFGTSFDPYIEYTEGTEESVSYNANFFGANF